jgi:hypothetical protein
MRTYCEFQHVHAEVEDGEVLHARLEKPGINSIDILPYLGEYEKEQLVQRDIEIRMSGPADDRGNEP